MGDARAFGGRLTTAAPAQAGGADGTAPASRHSKNLPPRSGALAGDAAGLGSAYLSGAAHRGSFERTLHESLRSEPLAAAGRAAAGRARAALAERLSAGAGSPQQAEFLQLFHEYERYVASIGSRILGPNNGVDDLVQEVFLVIFQEFHKLRELSSVKAWLATIATRLAWRQRGRSWPSSKLSLAQLDELSPLESMEASPELQADLTTLLERLRSMPDTLREPWLLRFIDGETLPRIAELCDCSQSTVQRRLREAGEVMLGNKAPLAWTEPDRSRR